MGYYLPLKGNGFVFHATTQVIFENTMQKWREPETKRQILHNFAYKGVSGMLHSRGHSAQWKLPGSEVRNWELLYLRCTQYSLEEEKNILEVTISDDCFWSLKPLNWKWWFLCHVYFATIKSSKTIKLLAWNSLLIEVSFHKWCWSERYQNILLPPESKGRSGGRRSSRDDECADQEVETNVSLLRGFVI